MIRQLRKNLERNGQIENLIVRELEDGTFEVINGNHRLDCILALGWNEVLVYNCGRISEAKAKRIAAEVNETRFGSDIAKLSKMMDDLAKEIGFDDLAETAPWDQAEMERLMQLHDFTHSEFAAHYETSKSKGRHGPKKKKRPDGKIIEVEMTPEIEQAFSLAERAFALTDRQNIFNRALEEFTK